MTGLRVGCAYIELTPPVGTRLSGFAGRPTPGYVSTGVRDPLFATALWLDGALVVSLDCIGLTPTDDRRLRRRLATALDIPPEAVLIACTHTHSGPATMTIRATGNKEVGYLKALFESVESAAWLARASSQALTDARLGSAPCAAAINRRKPDGPHDPLVRTLQLFTERGPLVTLVHFACHPVALGNQNTELSADWIARLRTDTEETLGCPTLFLQGCCGDINPRFGTNRGASEAERVGSEVALAVHQALAQSTPIALTAPSATHRTVYLPLNPPPSDPELTELEKSSQEKLRALGRSDIDEGILEWVAAVRQKGTKTRRAATVSRLNLGALTLIGLPGEIFSELGLALTEREGCWPIGFANGNLGYLYPDAALDEGGYEVSLAYRLYGEQQAGRGTAQALLRAATACQREPA